MTTTQWVGLVGLGFVLLVGIVSWLDENRKARVRERDAAWADGFAYGYETAKRLVTRADYRDENGQVWLDDDGFMIRQDD